MGRKNKERGFQVPKLNVKFGTISNDTPKAVYLECSGFISPKYSKESYSDEIKSMKHHISTSTNSFIKKCGLFKDNFVVITEISVPGIKKDKRSYIFIQAIFAQKTDNMLSFDQLTDTVSDNIRSLVFDYAECMEKEDFKVYKSKKTEE